MAEETYGVFDATLVGVTALIPTLEVIDTPRLVGQLGLTKEDVTGFIEEVSGAVDARLRSWRSLSNARQDQVAGLARALVHNGAASYAYAARHPGQATKTDSAYDQVLWARYSDGLDDLVRLVVEWSANPDETAAAADAALPGWAFPVARFDEGTRW